MKYLLFFFALSFIFTRGQSPIETDRPDQTESSAVVPKNAFQIESGIQVNYNGSNSTGGTEKAWLYPTNLLRYGLFDFLELRLVNELASSEINGESVEGLNDLQIGAKIQLYRKEESSTEVAFLTHAVAPTGTEGLSNEKWGTINRFLVSHQLTNTMSLGYNLGYNYFGSGQGDFVYTVALAWDVNDKLGLYIEPFGDWVDFNEFQHSFDAGLAYLVHDNLQLDLSFGTGLNHDMNYFAVGVSWRALGKKQITDKM